MHIQTNIQTILFRAEQLRSPWNNYVSNGTIRFLAEQLVINGTTLFQVPEMCGNLNTTSHLITTDLIPSGTTLFLLKHYCYQNLFHQPFLGKSLIAHFSVLHYRPWVLEAKIQILILYKKARVTKAFLEILA